MSDIILTFNSLYNLLREEKNNKILQQIPDKFYEAIEKYKEDKKKEIERLKSEKEVKKLEKEKRILKNSNNIIEKIIEERLIKISEIAIKNSIKSQEVLSEDRITNKLEKQFFKELQSLVNKFMEEVQ